MVKILIYRSFKQSAGEIYDLSHFKEEHVVFFNKKTFFQLKDAASAVLAREKSTFLAELFSVAWKFTIDTLNDWFSIIKPIFFELNEIKKPIHLKQNTIVTSKTTSCICGFLLNVQVSGEHKHWYDFIVERKHLFLTIFRMGIFGGAHGWRGRKQKNPPFLKSGTHILQ